MSRRVKIELYLKPDVMMRLLEHSLITEITVDEIVDNILDYFMEHGEIAENERD